MINENTAEQINRKVCILCGTRLREGESNIVLVCENRHHQSVLPGEYEKAPYIEKIKQTELVIARNQNKI